MPAPGPAAPVPDASAGPAWFEDVTKQVGLDFVHDPGPVGDYFMPQQVGSGAALFDFNNDGLLDIYLLQNGGPNGAKNRLYQQTRDHRFKDVSAGSGLDIAGYNMGVAIGDVNNDGLPDVLVTQYNGVKLFLNNGDGTFSDVTEESGLSNPAWGHVRLLLRLRPRRLARPCRRQLCRLRSDVALHRGGRRERLLRPKTFHGRVSRLFHNVTPTARSSSSAPRMRFEDVTESSGLGRLPGPGLGVVCADFDGDGWPDVFITDDGAANRLWINQKNGTFKEEAVRRGVAFNGMGAAQAGMGVALGDVNGDGLFDLYVTHLTEETNTLWRQGLAVCSMTKPRPRGWRPPAGGGRASGRC